METDRPGPPGTGKRADPVSGRVLWVIAAGGVLGALARYQAGLSRPTVGTGFPWTTLVINVVGCLLIGMLAVLAAERFDAHPLVRPFVGTGMLGGFTTFSTYSVDVHRLLIDGHPGIAVGYLATTAAAAVAAAALGVTVTRRVAGGRR